MRNLFLCLLIGAAALTAGCQKVPAGNVGVKYHLLGGDKGVDTEQLSPGRYWIGINEELYLFPTFTQTVVWTKEPMDGDDTDESISFQTIEGLDVNADVGMSFSVIPEKVPDLFQKYRKGFEEITDVYMRNMVRDALVTAGSKRPIETVYGAGKDELIREVFNNVKAQVEPLGINAEKMYWAGKLRLPDSIVSAINAKIAATQMAQQRRNEVERAKAEADKQVEAARGEAESRLLVAKAEADAIRIKGEALRENQRLVELSAIEKWDGKLPVYSLGGATPFIQIPGK